MSNYPTFKEMVTEAIRVTQDNKTNKPVSRQAIKKFIHANYAIPAGYWEARSKLGFNTLVNQGYLIKVSGSFLLSKEALLQKKASPKKKSEKCYTVHREYNVRDIKTSTIVKTFDTKEEALDFVNN
jgi:hypothetical protein